ncbi:hypothetical protein BDZ89DRAFT_1058829, partial [Hymenopellis radicata]
MSALHLPSHPCHDHQSLCDLFPMHSYLGPSFRNCAVYVGEPLSTRLVDAMKKVTPYLYTVEHYDRKQQTIGFKVALRY